MKIPCYIIYSKGLDRTKVLFYAFDPAGFKVQPSPPKDFDSGFSAGLSFLPSAPFSLHLQTLHGTAQSQPLSLHIITASPIFIYLN